MSGHQRLETKTQNINNQRLYEEIDTFMIEVFATLDNVRWSNKQHRDEFVYLIDDWMENFALDSGKIIQYEVLCNVDEDVHFIIRYRQKNCFNTSVIHYIIK